MIEVKDKFVGLVNDPDYTHCTGKEEFLFKIRNNGLDPQEIYNLIKTHLSEAQLIDSSEANSVLLGNELALEFNETFDVDTQTLYRTRTFENMSIFESLQSLNISENDSIIGKSLYKYELVSAEEV